MSTLTAPTGGAAVWTLDLGDDENRFSPDWVEEISRSLDEVERSAEPAVLLSTGSGRFYSNGLDIEWLGAHLDEAGDYVQSVQDLFARVLAFPLPTVAAVNGHAFGAGAMFALAHDFRVMREDRGFLCLPEVDMGVPFTDGMNALLLAKMTPQAAVATMTTARRIGGTEAAAIGVVDACAAQDELVDVARAMVADLAGKNRDVLAAIKEMMFADALGALRAQS